MCGVDATFSVGLSANALVVLIVDDPGPFWTAELSSFTLRREKN